MLLTEKASAIIELDKYKIDLRLDFKVIENLHYALQDEFICTYLNIGKMDVLDFISMLENYNESILILLLNVCSDGEYSILETKKLIEGIDDDSKESIFLIFRSVAMQSLIFINKDQENNEENTQEDTKESNNDNKFEEWFNYYYCMAIDKLRMSLEEFYKSTAAQIKERVYRFNLDKKNLYIMTYCDIVKSRNENATENKTQDLEEAAIDVFDFFNRI